MLTGRGIAQIIYADGRVTPFKPKNGTDFSLEELKEVVGGYIEIFDLHNGQILVVNVEGKLKGLPVILCDKEMVK